VPWPIVWNTSPEKRLEDCRNNRIASEPKPAAQAVFGCRDSLACRPDCCCAHRVSSAECPHGATYHGARRRYPPGWQLLLPQLRCSAGWAPWARPPVYCPSFTRAGTTAPPPRPPAALLHHQQQQRQHAVSQCHHPAGAPWQAASLTVSSLSPPGPPLQTVGGSPSAAGPPPGEGRGSGMPARSAATWVMAASTSSRATAQSAKLGMARAEVAGGGGF
jgi:hypothetical protein